MERRGTGPARSRKPDERAIVMQASDPPAPHTLEGFFPFKGGAAAFYHPFSETAGLVTRRGEVISCRSHTILSFEEPRLELRRRRNRQPRAKRRPSRAGVFITIEGIDGAGKSTQARLLAGYCLKVGYAVRKTREPGGTRLGEQIRHILLAGRRGNVGPLAELALIVAARAQHLEEVVRPALARGEMVVSDRFNDASLAYQGFGRKLGEAAVRAFDRVVSGRTQPDLTLLLDLDPRRARPRAEGRAAKRNSQLETFEAEGLDFQRRVRAGYLAIARREPGRVKVIRADRPVDEVQAEIRRAVDVFLAQLTTDH